jgi:hypothetical protein
MFGARAGPGDNRGRLSRPVPLAPRAADLTAALAGQTENPIRYFAAANPGSG